MSCKINWKSLILCKHCINRVQCRTKETSLMMSNFELSTGVPQRLNVGDPHLSQYYGATCRQGSSPDPLLKCCEGSEYFHLHSQNSSWKKSVYRVQPTRGKGKKWRWMSGCLHNRLMLLILFSLFRVCIMCYILFSVWYTAQGCMNYIWSFWLQLRLIFSEFLFRPSFKHLVSFSFSFTRSSSLSSSSFLFVPFLIVCRFFDVIYFPFIKSCVGCIKVKITTTFRRQRCVLQLLLSMG